MTPDGTESLVLLRAEYVLIPALLGYLLGSVPFGLLLTHIAGMGDIRAVGSGNIGATNVLRTGKKWLAALTLLLDGGKGVVAVIAAAYAYVLWSSGVGGYPIDVLWWSCIGGIAAVVGHVFPVWLRFKGGKGVATAIGVFLALYPLTGVAAILTWLVAAGASRRSSVGGMVAMVAAPVVALIAHMEILAAVTTLIAVLVIVRHKDNIRRLIDGTEPRIGRSKSADERR
jgi:glycerol-3-phosphate acyltransferase PlsY